MTRPYRAARTALVALSLSALPASADITASGLWSHWQALGGQAGEAADTGETGASGDTLTLRQVSFTRDVAGAPTTATFDELRLQGTPEGGVEVTIPGGQAVSVLSEGERAVFRLGPETLLVTATGTLPAPGYALDAARMAMTLEEWDAPDRPAQADLSAILSGVAATMTTDAGAPSTLSLAATGLDIAAIAADPVAGTMTHTAEQTEITVDAVLGSAEGNATLGAGPGNIATSSATPDGARTSVTASKQAHSVQVNWSDLDTTSEISVDGIEAALGGLPTKVDPLRMAIARLAVTVSGPAAITDGPAPIAASGAFEGVVLDPSTWSQIDPSGALPRDPAHLRFDISGTARPADPASDPTAPASAGTIGPMMVPDNVTINGLEIGAAGAEAQARGQVRLPPTGPGGLPDLSRPVGEITVTATGVMGLMQALSAAGIVPGDQVMGAQMMLGMFATVGPGDTLRSVIEAGEDGSLTVNGTRVR